MPTWKIMAILAASTAALITTIAHHRSNGFERFARNSRQQSHQILPAEKPDTSKTPDAEPWGPFRTTDW
jgi:hypothetical protein